MQDGAVKTSDVELSCRSLRSLTEPRLARRGLVSRGSERRSLTQLHRFSQLNPLPKNGKAFNDAHPETAAVAPRDADLCRSAPFNSDLCQRIRCSHHSHLSSPAACAPWPLSPTIGFETQGQHPPSSKNFLALFCEMHTNFEPRPTLPFSITVALTVRLSSVRSGNCRTSRPSPPPSAPLQISAMRRRALTANES